MSGDCARKLKTGFVCGDVVEIVDGLWTGEGKFWEITFLNLARCKYDVVMKLPDGFTIRRASEEEIDTLVTHRRSMFRDMGYSDDAAVRQYGRKMQTVAAGKDEIR